MLPQEAAAEEVLFAVPVVVEEVRDAVSSVSAVDDEAAGGVPDRFRSPAVIDAAVAAVILAFLPSLLLLLALVLVLLPDRSE
jgi:hypothetical protein